MKETIPPVRNRCAAGDPQNKPSICTQRPCFVRIAAAVVMLLAGVAGLMPMGCRVVPVGPAPPEQPMSGPGGADYTHASVRTVLYGVGQDAYWIFLPEDPVPETAPFVVFLHGWSAIDPTPYGAWIEHIVRKGHIVVYPRYQQNLISTPQSMVKSARNAVVRAWNRLISDGPTRPQTDAIVWFGHSLGATYSAMIAGLVEDDGLPRAAALLLVEPGGENFINLDNIGRIPTSARVTIIVGDEDTVAREAGAAAVISGLTHMPPENVEQIRIVTDKRSFPPLVADHYAPLAVIEGFPPPDLIFRKGMKSRLGASSLEFVRSRNLWYDPNALDYYCFWKIGDGILDSVFRGENGEYAYGGTQEQRYMGKLEDGEPVEPLQVFRPLE